MPQEIRGRWLMEHVPNNPVNKLVLRRIVFINSKTHFIDWSIVFKMDGDIVLVFCEPPNLETLKEIVVIFEDTLKELDEKCRKPR